MKSRAEMMAERKAALKVGVSDVTQDSSPKSKTSASSRTLPIPGTDATVHCSDCDEDMSTSDLKKREDGSFECSGCAMPLKVGGKESRRAHQLASQGGTVRTKEMDDAIEEDKKKKSSVETRTGTFCGKCGAEWPTLKGKEMRNCGHEDALGVDDPRKATNMKDVTASGVTKPPATPVNNREVPPNVTMTVEGNRVTLHWGKVIFPVGEALGISKFSNMDIGPFSISETFEPATFLETVRRMLANLQKIANMTFDVQFVWYKEKLGLLDK